MSKKQKRTVSLLVTLAFLLTLVLPMGAALAGTTYEAITAIPEFDPGSAAAENLELAKIYVKIDPTVAGTSSALVEVLDASGKLLKIKSISKTNADATATPVNPDPSGYSKTWRYDIGDLAAYSGNKFTDTLTLVVDAKGAAAGDVSVRFSNATGQLKNGTVVAAVAKGAAVEVTAITAPTIGDGGGKATIRLRETAAGALKVSANSVKFRLPAGFTWASPSGPTMVAGTGLVGSVRADERDLVISITNASTTTAVVDISATIVVDPSQAKAGEVKATISGDSSLTATELKVATYAEYSVSVSGADAKDVVAGKREQEIGKIVIEEKLPGTLVAGRTIYLTLPDKVKWDENNYPTVSEGDSSSGHAVLSSFTAVGTDRRTIKATVQSPSSGGGSQKLVLKGGKVTVAADFAGDIEVQVSGSAGASGKAKVAVAKAPIAVTASGAPEVVIGLQAQAGADLTITETKAEALKDDSYLEIVTPPGVRFAAAPTFAVTDGDLTLGSVVTDTDWEWVQVKVKTASSVPSTIKVSNIKLIVDRTVPEGQIVLKVGGDALVENAFDPYFADVMWAARVPVAKVITPAPKEETVTATFTVGSTSYKVGGQEKTMDVAPFIENNRTYLPIRYAAYAVGVGEDSIFWDNATRTATIVKGDRVVQLVADSWIMRLNGAEIRMDAEAKIVNGRFVLPIRWVANALGCQVAWDEAKQTVTVTQ